MKIYHEGVVLKQNQCVFSDVRPKDELRSPEVAGYEKISIFYSVLDLDTQVK